MQVSTIANVISFILILGLKYVSGNDEIRERADENNITRGIGSYDNREDVLSSFGGKKTCITTKDLLNRFLYLIPNPLSQQRDCTLKWISHYLILLKQENIIVNDVFFEKLVLIIEKTMATTELFSKLCHECSDSEDASLSVITNIHELQIEVTKLRLDLMKTAGSENCPKWESIQRHINEQTIRFFWGICKKSKYFKEHDDHAFKMFKKRFNIPNIQSQLYKNLKYDIFVRRVYLYYNPSLKEYNKFIRDSELSHITKYGHYATLFTIKGENNNMKQDYHTKQICDIELIAKKTRFHDMNAMFKNINTLYYALTDLKSMLAPKIQFMEMKKDVDESLSLVEKHQALLRVEWVSLSTAAGYPDKYFYLK